MTGSEPELKVLVAPEPYWAWGVRMEDWGEGGGAGADTRETGARGEPGLERGAAWGEP